MTIESNRNQAPRSCRLAGPLLVAAAALTLIVLSSTPGWPNYARADTAALSAARFSTPDGAPLVEAELCTPTRGANLSSRAAARQNGQEFQDAPFETATATGTAAATATATGTATATATPTMTATRTATPTPTSPAPHYAVYIPYVNAGTRELGLASRLVERLLKGIGAVFNSHSGVPAS
ncbi:MAG: hypothetical protein ACYC6L_00440 [Anaerolineae bacterium]